MSLYVQIEFVCTKEVGNVRNLFRVASGTKRVKADQQPARNNSWSAGLSSRSIVAMLSRMPSPTLRLSQPLTPSLEQKLRRYLAGNPLVQHVSSLLTDLRALSQQQLWFEDLGTVLLVYTREGEHVGYIAAE